MPLIAALLNVTAPARLVNVAPDVLAIVLVLTAVSKVDVDGAAAAAGREVDQPAGAGEIDVADGQVADIAAPDDVGRRVFADREAFQRVVGGERDAVAAGEVSMTASVPGRQSA